MSSQPQTIHHGQGHTEHHEHVDSLGLYLGIFFTLLVLLILTVGAYFIPFEKYTVGGIKLDFMNTVIALTIATIKALLVILFFMHIRHATRLTWVVCGAGFIWLMIMFVFTFADYLSRHAIPEAMKEPPAMAHIGELEH